MKVLSAFAVVLLAGCSVGPTMDELENRALLTGNWAEVEKHERSLARRQSHRGIQCPENYVSYCDNRIGRLECGCVQKDDFRKIMGRY